MKTAEAKELKPVDSPETVEFPLSTFQNQVVSGHQLRIHAAGIEVDKAQREVDQTQELLDAKRAALEARKAVQRSEQDSQNVFLSYIVNEFELPKTKDEKGWMPQQIKPGEYRLVGEVDSLPTAAGPRIEPKHQWKRRKDKTSEAGPVLAAVPPAEHNPTA